MHVSVMQMVAQSSATLQFHVSNFMYHLVSSRRDGSHIQIELAVEKEAHFRVGFQQYCTLSSQPWGH